MLKWFGQIFLGIVLITSGETTAKAEGTKPEAVNFQMTPLTIPIIKEDKVIGYAQIGIELTPGPAVAAEAVSLPERAEQVKELEKCEPLFRDAFFVDLFNAFTVLWDARKDPNPEAIKQRLQNQVDILGKKGILKGTPIRVTLSKFIITRATATP